MPPHPETNPHFAPPQHQRDGRIPSPPPEPPHLHSKGQTPKNLPGNQQFNRSGGYDSHWWPPQPPTEEHDHFPLDPNNHQPPKSQHLQNDEEIKDAIKPPPPTERKSTPQRKPRMSTGSRRREEEHGLWAPAPSRTTAITWICAVFCAMFWVTIFVGGLIVLIIYVLYRPRSPRFDISDATVNVAYIDAGSLLNADVTLYANFTNPNRKMSVDFRELILDLYFEDSLISTQYIAPFKIPRSSVWFTYVHMLTSQVRLPLKLSRKLEEEMAKNAIIFKVKGFFRVHSYLASFLKYSYTLHGHCSFMVTAPPSGITRAIKCSSKR